MAIKPKQTNEPILSQEIQNIINKSHGLDNPNDKYDDIERYKYFIMKILTENQDILHTLHNKELEERYTDKDGIINGDAYRDVNIYSFLKIPDIQSTVKNFICFEVDDREKPRNSDGLIVKNITFRTISHENDYKTDWGIARQDLLATIITSCFDWTNMFGAHLEMVYNKGRIAENGYYYREFIYQITDVNNLVNKSKNSNYTYYDYRNGGVR